MALPPAAAAYNFDEVSGPVLDLTGHGYDFTLTANTVRTPNGHTDQGLTQSAPTTQTGPSLAGLQTTSRTWMCWIEFLAAVNGWVLEFHNLTADTGVWGLLDISGTLRFRAKDASNTVYDSPALDRQIGTYWHLAATHDGANLRYYVNGGLVATVPMAVPVWDADVLRVLDQTGSNVRIDDVRFFTEALDQATILEAAGTPVVAPSETVTADLSGVLPAISGTLAADVLNPAALTGVLPALTGSFGGEALNVAGLNGVLPALTGALDATIGEGVVLSGSLPAMTGKFTATAEQPPATGDTFAKPYADRLLSCLCEALQATVGGPVCRCCLYPGIAPPPADSCCNCPNGSQGQATVQITELFPTQRFPARGLGEATPCRTYGWGAELTMTVYRCVPVPGEDGTPPDCADLTAATGKILADAQAMLAAVLCCDWNPDNQPIIPGTWHPLPNRGGCGGGQMTVTVYLGGRCCATEL